MTVAETRPSVWDALAGRAADLPAGRADSAVRAAVVERLDPARATPALRPGIERADLSSARDLPYVMLRTPEGDGPPHYLRLTPEEVELTELMDGGLTVAQLVAEFARISGRLAPDQVTRLVADLAANRMLRELPGDVMAPATGATGSWPARWGRAALAAVRGRRLVVADIDRPISTLYRFAGRWLFTPAAAGIVALFLVLGLGLFAWTWSQGDASVFLTGGSYATGAAVLLGMHLVGLVVHELGHALAAKHAGRRVPAAGFLIFFGVPSVFVDTSDVWLAGRRARLLTTLSGPAAALALAGLAQTVGLLYPPAAGLAFKLAFVAYAQALVYLNPFLPLDGHFLLADLLEVPNLRTRALAWLRTRLRPHRPMPRLDPEGRLIALYGVAGVLWLVITALLAYRMWTDRMGGLAIGLWPAGWSGRLLLIAIGAVLCAPILHGLAGWCGRLVRRLRRRLAHRDETADLSRRLAVLRASQLGRLPEPALAELAALATWQHPPRGQVVVAAGAVAPDVLVVADGAAEARAPADPVGAVRQRVGAGGVIGLAGALTGAPSPLAWHTVGTTLLAVPAPAVATAVGPLPGPAVAERTEAEALFADTPALETLPIEDRMALALAATPHDLGPGDPIRLPARNTAVVIGQGVIVLPEGTVLRRGTMIGPVDADLPEPVAFARSEVRLWTLPPVAELPTLPGIDGGRAAGQAPIIGRRPRSGVHPTGPYPPLAAPPGPPPPADDDVADRHFERGMWWLVGALTAVALLLGVGALLPGPAWAEMPGDRALLRGERGSVSAAVGGRTVRLTTGDQVYVRRGDRIEVAAGGEARLTFRGGSTVVLCAGSRAEIGELVTPGGLRPMTPRARLELRHGRLLADTATPSHAFDALALTVGSQGSTVVNDGSAWYAVGIGQVKVSAGQVRRDGAPLPMTSAPLTCGDGVPVDRPGGTPSEVPSPEPRPAPTPSATPTPTPTPTGQPPRTAEPTPDRPTRPAATPTGGGAQPTPPDDDPPPPPPDDDPPPPPPNTAPTVTLSASVGTIQQVRADGTRCVTDGPPTTASVTATVTDDAGAANVKVTLTWSGDLDNGTTTQTGDALSPLHFGPFEAPDEGRTAGSIQVHATAVDAQQATGNATVTIDVAACPAVEQPAIEEPPPPAG